MGSVMQIDRDPKFSGRLFAGDQLWGMCGLGRGVFSNIYGIRAFDLLLEDFWIFGFSGMLV